MGASTGIEWTNSTWNPVRGCTRVSRGCGGPGDHGGCYAEVMAARFSKPGQWGHGFAEMRNGKARWTGKLALDEDALLKPLSWKTGRRIFVNSTSDLFHESLPDEAIDRVFAVMALCPQHTFQVLTKRPERMREYFRHDDGFGRWGYIEHHARRLAEIPSTRTLATFGGKNLPNVWLGTSVEDQPTADERIPFLLDTPAAIHFISGEPLLGPIDLTQIDDGSAHREVPKEEWGPMDNEDSPPALWWNALTGERAIMHGGNGGDWCRRDTALDWVICGGESGPNARPMHPNWARALRDQCADAGVSYFFKQHGEWLHETQTTGTMLPYPEKNALHQWADETCSVKIGKKAAGRLLYGIEHNGFPEALS